MASTYNPYNDIKAIADLKSQWEDANAKGDNERKNTIAGYATQYYNNLKNNGSSMEASLLSSFLDSQGAYGLLKNYTPTTTTPTIPATTTSTNKVMSSGSTSSNKATTDNQSYNASMKSATNNNKKLSSYINSDRIDMHNKYDDLYDYANQNVTKTDEYKSTYNNMMAKYDLSALQGRDNAVASGGSSNGGNIDSYSAANAMRQQASLTATGQQVAHQAGLDAYNARVSNVANILQNLGIYNNDTYTAMNQVIANDSNIAQQYFDNDETAKNNEVARLSEKASVTGYVPNEWAYENNIYLNSDGTVKNEYLTDEFDSTGGFTTIINNAKAKLATTTDATERANLQATIDQATQAKALKTYSSPKYAKYANEVTAVPGQRTAEYNLTDKQIASAERISNAEATAAALKSASEAESESAKAYYEYMAKAYAADADKYAADKEYEAKMFEANSAEENWSIYEGLMTYYQDDDSMQSFVQTFLQPDDKTGAWKIKRPDLKAAMMNQNNIVKYNIDKADALYICEIFDLETDWLDNYRDRNESDGEGKYTDDKGNEHERSWKDSGMVKK